MKTEANKMTKQPSYRFAGFEDAWKEVKLGDFVEISKGIQRNKEFLSPNADNKNCYPVYNGGKQESGYTDEFNREGNIMISEGGASAGFVNYFNGKYWSGGHNFTIDELENDIYYVLALLESQQQELYSLQVGSGLPNIQLNSLKKVIIAFPSFLEQQAIGSFFQDIDQLISLQQRKLEVLKEQKKTYLKLLFPAKGQAKPALRFAGFEDEWKEVKLGEVTDIKTGGRDVQNSVEDGLYPFYIRSEEVKRINSYSFDGEAILIPGEGRLGEIFHYANGKFDVHQRVYKISNFTDVNAKFVLQQMKKDFKQHAMRNTVKATVDSLRLPTIQSFNILVPSLPEQTAIGSFFQDLDKAIAKQEEKINQLKESKQTFLKEMFI